ncbi:MAG TPA: hypothetical protein VGJ26_13895 [Pirellulales bacterium]|jgi:hypothetical protein
MNHERRNIGFRRFIMPELGLGPERGRECAARGRPFGTIRRKQSIVDIAMLRVMASLGYPLAAPVHFFTISHCKILPTIVREFFDSYAIRAVGY